jgi:flagellar assembly protein FliH
VRSSSLAAGEMILLSNVFKPYQYTPVEETKTIEFVPRPYPSRTHSDGQGSLEDGQEEKLQELDELKQQILRDAEAFAEEQLQAAAEEAGRLREQALQEIESWWSERRAQDEETMLEAKEAGFQQGYEAGLAEAEQRIRQEYAAMLEEGRSVIAQAVQIKQEIIAESEPFLIDLAAGIAEKVIGRQLELEPDWVLELVRNTLSRRREKGVITLCVSPSQFSFIQNARDELLLSIDSQAELQIIPDATVKDYGCVVRSSFGSIDARIGTQLDEIKAVLRQIAEQSGESDDE